MNPYTDTQGRYVPEVPDSAVAYQFWGGGRGSWIYLPHEAVREEREWPATVVWTGRIEYCEADMGDSWVVGEDDLEEFCACLQAYVADHVEVKAVEGETDACLEYAWRLVTVSQYASALAEYKATRDRAGLPSFGEQRFRVLKGGKA